MAKVTRGQLRQRTRADNGALKEQFTNTGVYALCQVLTGRLELDKATEILGQLRDMWLDENGDLAPSNKVKQYLKRNRMLKGTDMQYYV